MEKTSVTLLALAMISMAFVGMAAAGGPPYAPSGGEGWVGPRPQDDCSAPQALGAGGDASGSSGGSGASGYHSYANADARVGPGLDACLSMGDGPVRWALCDTAPQREGLDKGAPEVVTGVTTGNVPLVFEGVNDITDPWFWGYPPECGTFFGATTDGEFEWGSNEAILNVRAGAWEGVTACIGPLATPHHAADTTVFVEDAASGGDVGFTLAADWGSPDEPCGDGVIEPCDGSGSPCNPLDVALHVGPAGAGSSVNAYDVTTLLGPGKTLKDFGNGGAAGYLYVLLDPLAGAGGSASTVGWVWTGGSS
jgi:hypothetical protein